MFIRKKPNKSGSVSVQIIQKRLGKTILIKTIGCSSDPAEIENLVKQAKHHQENIIGQESIGFEEQREIELLDIIYNSINRVHLVGPELILGKIFDEIGFNKIEDEIFRDLVIARISYPASKLKTIEYLNRLKDKSIDVASVYRYLDKLHKRQKNIIQNISYEHTLKILDSEIKVVFYDVTTLYFETDNQDDLRVPGFSKDGKHSSPQIILGLLLSIDGYPLAYEIFEGNKYEGHTMLPILEGFKKRYNIEKLVVVADAGLLSNANITELQTKGYEYILGGRIKNETRIIQNKILQLSLQTGESADIVKDENTRIIISYSDKRAKKDEFNRNKGLAKLEASIIRGNLTKSNINNRGYNKFLKMEGNVKISIDNEKLLQDKKWNGLKGYITNTKLKKEEVIAQYGNLWKIEKAFRISKTDLKIRPIYHRLRHRIEAHICIAFCSYKIYKELERQLKGYKSLLSVEKVIEIANTIYEISITTPLTNRKEKRLLIKNKEQVALMKMFNLV